MTHKYQRVSAAIALTTLLAVGQVYTTVSRAETISNPTSSISSQQVMGILTTTGNKSITVNGAGAVSGASIPSGAVIETPAGVGATIRLGALGSLCVAPNTKLTVIFDPQGRLVNVVLTEGCVILRSSKNVAGTINSAQGNIGKIDAATGGSLDICMRPGEAPTINRGAAVDAGAGASAVDCGAAGAAALPSGIPPAATVAFIGGGAAGLYLLFRGGNPSPSGP